MIVFNPIIDIGIIVLLGVTLLLLTVFTYWKVSSRLTTGKRLFLMFSRIFACALLILILLQPSRQFKDKLKKDELKIGVALDVSKSMNQNDVKGQKRIDYIRTLATEEVGSGNIPLEFMAFDQKAKSLSKEQLEQLEADGNTTRIHDSIKDLYSRQNSYGMKAVILLTDGHDLQEADPGQTSQIAVAHHSKIFAVPIGNKGRVRDIHVNVSASQDYIFKGNKVGLTAHIRARSCEFEKISVQLFRNRIMLDQKELNLGDIYCSLYYRHIFL